MESLPNLNQLSRSELETLAGELWLKDHELSLSIQSLENQLIAFLHIPNIDVLERDEYVRTLSALGLNLPTVLPVSVSNSVESAQHSKGEVAQVSHQQVGPEIDQNALKYLLKQHELWITSDKGLGARFHLNGRYLAPNVSLKGAWLINADLKGAQLSHCDLSEANLIRAELSDADLTHARLDHATLVLCDLSRANLTSARLTYSNLGMANLKQANLSRVSGERVNFQYAHLEQAILKEGNFENAFLIESHLEEADLTAAHFKGADLSGAILKNAVVRGAFFNGASLKNVKGLSADKMSQVKFDSETSWPTEDVLQIKRT